MALTRRQFLKGGAVIAGLRALTTTPVSEGSSKEAYSELERIAKAWESEVLSFIETNKDYIIKSAESHKLPPEFLASVLYYEKGHENIVRRIYDFFKSIIFDTSVGDGQIKISAATTADGRDPKRLSIEEHLTYRRKLLETPSNIDYVAKRLRSLIDRPNRYPGINPEDLIENPKAMAIAATEYNLGDRSSSRETAKPNIEGFVVIAELVDGSPLYKIFGRQSQSEGQKIRGYLEDNRALINEAIRNYEVERDRTSQRRIGYGTLSLVALGGLGWAISKLRQRINYHASIKP